MTMGFMINAGFALVNAYFVFNGDMPALSMTVALLNAFVAGQCFLAREIDKELQ